MCFNPPTFVKSLGCNEFEVLFSVSAQTRVNIMQETNIGAVVMARTNNCTQSQDIVEGFWNFLKTAVRNPYLQGGKRRYNQCKCLLNTCFVNIIISFYFSIVCK